MSGNAVALTIVVIMFAAVTLVGFAAARWRQAEDRLHLNEWGLGGRGFGIFITWFLLGGDIYTAYTFIAVPALVYGVGALGFFAVPYTIIVFPIVFVFAPRLWSVSRVHGYITPADFVRGRYGSHGLALAVAVTGILATMPYIALQLVGIQAVLTVLGVHGDWPLIIAFVVLAALHLGVGAAGAGPDRLHQGHPHLRDDHRGDLLHPGQAGRLGPHLLHRGRAPGADQPQDRQAVRLADHRPHRRMGLLLARPRLRAWRCSCTRTR